MKKVNSNVQVAELDTFSDSTLGLYDDSEAVQGDTILKIIVDEERTLSEELTIANKRTKDQSGLEEADIVRDEATNSLFTMVNAYAVFPVADTAEKGKLLKAVIDKYTGITRQKYATQSALTESLLVDLAADSLKDAIESLSGMAAQIALLRSAEDAFKAANKAIVDAKSEKGESATEIRKQLLACINEKLISYLNVVSVVQPDVYGTFAGKIEIEVDRVNASIARRSKSASSSDDSGTDSTTA